MINLVDINDNFNKNRNFIIDILINYYGHEYADVIKKRLDNVFFDFSSTPEEDYNFSRAHGNQINKLSKLLINLRYKEFKKVQNESRSANLKALIEYIKIKLQIDNFDIVNIESETFLSLFTDNNFNSGFIDAFSSKSIELLNDPNISKSMKENIIHDQEEFKRIINSLGIKLENLSTNDVNELIEYRKKLQTIYKNSIIQKSKYGKNMFKEIRKKFGVELTPENLSAIALLENAWAGYIRYENENGIAYHQIIKIPLLHLMNLGIKGLDVNIIHELIHKIETSRDYVGISIHDNNNTNNIINEIRTQYLAIRITKELHKSGIYMYDNPNDYKIEGESTYETLFPLTKDFLDEHETLFSNCAINNTPQKLDEYFGEFWEEFSKKINSIYYDHMHLFSRTHSMPCINANDNITELINSMNLFKGRSVKNV